jgi:hypothetical protein
MKLPIDYTKAHWTVRKEARLQYIKEQYGLCWFCKQQLTKEPSKEVSILRINERLFPKNFFSFPIHLHHDHKTGLTIGAVHAKCNAVLWQYHGE